GRGHRDDRHRDRRARRAHGRSADRRAGAAGRSNAATARRGDAGGEASGAAGRVADAAVPRRLRRRRLVPGALACMADASFMVEMLAARHGDALMIEYARAGGRTRRMLIDGGPLTAYPA